MMFVSYPFAVHTSTHADISDPLTTQAS